MARTKLPGSRRRVSLYLEESALDRIQAALARLPGNASLSSLLSDQLPALADLLEKTADAFEARDFQRFSDVLTELTDDMNVKAAETRRDLRQKGDSVRKESGAIEAATSKSKRVKKSA